MSMEIYVLMSDEHHTIRTRGRIRKLEAIKEESFQAPIMEELAYLHPTWDLLLSPALSNLAQTRVFVEQKGYFPGKVILKGESTMHGYKYTVNILNHEGEVKFKKEYNESRPWRLAYAGVYVQGSGDYIPDDYEYIKVMKKMFPFEYTWQDGFVKIKCPIGEGMYLESDRITPNIQVYFRVLMCDALEFTIKDDQLITARPFKEQMELLGQLIGQLLVEITKKSMVYKKYFDIQKIDESQSREYLSRFCNLEALGMEVLYLAAVSRIAQPILDEHLTPLKNLLSNPKKYSNRTRELVDKLVRMFNIFKHFTHPEDLDIDVLRMILNNVYLAKFYKEDQGRVEDLFGKSIPQVRMNAFGLVQGMNKEFPKDVVKEQVINRGIQHIKPSPTNPTPKERGIWFPAGLSKTLFSALSTTCQQIETTTLTVDPTTKTIYKPQAPNNRKFPNSNYAKFGKNLLYIQKENFGGWKAVLYTPECKKIHEISLEIRRYYDYVYIDEAKEAVYFNAEDFDGDLLLVKVYLYIEQMDKKTLGSVKLESIVIAKEDSARQILVDFHEGKGVIGIFMNNSTYFDFLSPDIRSEELYDIMSLYGMPELPPEIKPQPTVLSKRNSSNPEMAPKPDLNELEESDPFKSSTSNVMNLTDEKEVDTYWYKNSQIKFDGKYILIAENFLGGDDFKRIRTVEFTVASVAYGLERMGSLKIDTRPGNKPNVQLFYTRNQLFGLVVRYKPADYCIVGLSPSTKAPIILVKLGADKTFRKFMMGELALLPEVDKQYRCYTLVQPLNCHDKIYFVLAQRPHYSKHVYKVVAYKLRI